jgi:hypothetical protein
MAGNDIDWAAVNAAHRQWIADGKHLTFICPIEGGSIRGWTSI